MQANSYSPYALKDLHQAIDLMDRKIAYCTTLEPFESEDDRAACLRKLSTKRAALVKSALTLSSMGVQCDPRFLPRSFAQAAAGPAAGEEAIATIPSGPARPERKSSQRSASKA